MSSLKELRDVRLEKLLKLRKLGVDPYPAKSHKNSDCENVLTNFEKLQGKNVVVAGRIASLRSHGAIIFLDVKDASGKVQVLVKKDALSTPNYKTSQLGFEDFDLLDVGDFLEVTGTVTKTQRGEVSVEAQEVRLLVKSLRPLPNAWDGLKDKETRFRRRYLDTNMNPDVYQRFLRRAKFWEAHREFFKQKGFHEMNIPVLELVPGGADATPFITHMDAIDQDFYLRISQELYLKRLIGGGYEKVYEIGPRFRNEGLSDEHLPEHIAMEFYWAYADWQDGMKFIKELFDYVIKQVYGDKRVFKIRGFNVDFSTWETIDFGEVVKNKYNIDIHNITLEQLAEVLKNHGLKANGVLSLARGIDILWKNIRKNIGGPAFLINHPKYLSPLQKPSVENPSIVERFQPIVGGTELGNGWSELNDAVDQYDRFMQQQKMREAGDKEAQWLDIDYVEMLEYGMPPTFGYGHSERVFWFLEDVPAREGVPFPQLKLELEETTKEIYGL